MTIGNIGELYNTKNVKVGSAVGFIAPLGTPDPADSLTVFDPAVWLASAVQLGGATGGTETFTLSGGPLASPVTTAPVAFSAATTAVAAAINAVLPVGYTATVQGVAGAFSISINGPLGGQVVVTANFSSLTGATGSSITPSPWLSAGATEQGWQVNWNPTTTQINIDEQPTPVDEGIDSATLQFVANLSEDTLQTWGFALNANKTVIAPATGVYGKQILQPSTVLKKYKVVLETNSVLDTPRRYIIQTMTCAANVGATFKRSGTQRLIPVTFNSVGDFSSIQVVDIVSAPTG